MGRTKPVVRQSKSCGKMETSDREPVYIDIKAIRASFPKHCGL